MLLQKKLDDKAERRLLIHSVDLLLGWDQEGCLEHQLGASYIPCIQQTLNSSLRTASSMFLGFDRVKGTMHTSFSSGTNFSHSDIKSSHFLPFLGEATFHGVIAGIQERRQKLAFRSWLVAPKNTKEEKWKLLANISE